MGVTVAALKVLRMTPAGMRRVCPADRAASPDRPLAAASLYQSPLSPHRLAATACKVSPPRAVMLPADEP